MFQARADVSSVTWGELLILPENRSAIRAAKRLVASSGRTSLTRLIVLHGPPGVGKSAIVQTLARMATAGAEPQTARVLPAAELRTEDDEEAELLELRICDLLVVEDLHHLKPSDAPTVCRLLDDRQAHRRATVVTSSTGPANLTTFPHRLTNRLTAGLIIKLNTLGRESRISLAEWLAAKRKLRLAPESVVWLAETAVSTRALIGLIDQLRPLGKRSAQPLTIDQVREHLTEPVADSSPPLDRIVSRVCEIFRVKRKDVLGASRLRSVLVPRQVAMYLAREAAKIPLVQIGQYFGGRDHTTVLHAVRKVGQLLATDEKLATVVNELHQVFE
jgi:chromosomal replication initiator protein